MNWLNPAAFANPPAATALGQADLAPFGGEATQVRGPNYRRIDLSLFKDFPITGGQRFEFRVEVFNLTNTPNFSSPGFSPVRPVCSRRRASETLPTPRISVELRL